MNTTTTMTTAEGISYRDLNGNGRLDPYEDPRLTVEERVEDLVGRLTLEEKAGLMVQSVTNASTTGELADEDPQDGRFGTRVLVEDKLITHINLHSIPEPRLMARWGNQVQKLAMESSPHGIPVTFSTDPRHSFLENFGASFTSQHFSAWPEPIGLGALRDPDAVREFAEIARQEYTAVGLRAALHPTVDLATEPRWARQYSTFGDDPEIVAANTLAYLEGFEGDTLGADSVACMAKHFPGGGPQKDGEDAHFPYGREQVYPGGRFEDHLEPFRRAISHGVSAIMPYYGMPIGVTWRGKDIEEVGFGFNRQIITGLLREELGFDGVVCTDWGLITESRLFGRRLPPRAWGVEHLSVPDRMLKVLDAGCDQFGGEENPEVLVDLVQSGRLPEERLDQSVRRLLAVKFRLGLFDDPFVDEDRAERDTGTVPFREAGLRAQAQSATLLVNATPADGNEPILPLSPGTRVNGVDIDENEISEAGLVPVGEDGEPDVHLVRLAAPFEPRDEYMLEAAFHAGSLEFPADVAARFRDLARTAPVALVVHLDRPAVLTELVPSCTAVVGVYGASDEAVLKSLTGAEPMRGRLPFELPRSMSAVVASRPDVRADSVDPLWPSGYGEGAR